MRLRRRHFRDAWLSFKDIVAYLSLALGYLGLMHDRVGHSRVQSVVDTENLASVLVRHILELLAHFVALQFVSFFSFFQEVTE